MLHLKIRRVTSSRNGGLTFDLLGGELQLKKGTMQTRPLDDTFWKSDGPPAELTALVTAGASEPLSTLITVFRVDPVSVCICLQDGVLFARDLGLDAHLLTVCTSPAAVGVVSLYF